MPTYNNTVRSDSLTTALGATPVSGDVVNLREGSDNYVSGLSHPTVDLLALNALSGWTGNIEGTDLVVQANQAGSGRVRLDWSGRRIRLSSNTTGTFAEISMNPARNGEVILSAAVVTKMIVAAGVLLASDSANIGTHQQYGGSAWLAYSTNALTTGRLYAGELRLDRDVTTLDVDGGTARVSNINVSPTTVNLRGGTLRAELCGTISTLNGYSGILDASQLSASLTVSAGELHPGLLIVLPKTAGVNLNLTGCTVVGSGPRYQ